MRDAVATTAEITDLLRAGAAEVIDVRCAAGTVVTRVLKRGEGAAGGARRLVEVPCRLCREAVYREIGGKRGDVLVVHYVDVELAEVVRSRAIRYPRPAARDINRGGQLIPDSVYNRAIEAYNRGTQSGQREAEATEVSNGR